MCLYSSYDKKHSSKIQNSSCRGRERQKDIVKVTSEESAMPGQELKPRLSSLGPTQNMWKSLFSAVKSGEKGTHICQ